MTPPVDTTAPPTAVLVIEDSPSQLLAIRLILERAGYAVGVAESSEDALEMLDSFSPDLILCDIMLPGMDGFEFCRRVKASETLGIGHLPFILVTSLDRPEDIVKGLAAGANDYVTKPINPEVLLARMRTHLRLEEMRREVEIKNRELSLRNSELERNLEQARRVQKSFLPDRIPMTDKLDVAVRYLPHDKIGGDHYDLIPLGEDCYLVLIADVSGHGISGALFTATVKMLFNRAVARSTRPATILEEMNLAMLQGGQPQFFLTAICAIIEYSREVITYTNAGHPGAILRRRDGGCVTLDSQVVPLNISDDTVFVENVLPFERGDCVVFYTDGVIECTNSAREQYGAGTLRKVIEGVRDGGEAEDIVEAVISDVKRFAGEPARDDDVSVIAVRRR